LSKGQKLLRWHGLKETGFVKSIQTITQPLLVKKPGFCVRLSLKLSLETCRFTRFCLRWNWFNVAIAHTAGNFT
jgi:hypothetical protein